MCGTWPETLVPRLPAMTARPQQPSPQRPRAPRHGASSPEASMIALRALEQDLRQRLHDIHARLDQLYPRASAAIAADVRRNDLCDSAQAMCALEAQTMSVERLTLTAQRITERSSASPTAPTDGARSATSRSRPRA